MIASPTTSPYLSALQRAAVAYRPAKHDITSSDGDFCFSCGNPTQSAVAYCSDACRAQDERTSPLLSPAPTALPALVPSRSNRRLHKAGAGTDSSPPSSATSSPLKTAEGEDEEEDIEHLALGPPASSYSKKTNFNYAYSLATSPVTTRSPITSPIARATPMYKQSSAQSNSAINQHGTTPKATTTPPMNPSEVITFRRRHQPDSLNGTKGGALSPALLARRRSSNNNHLYQSNTSAHNTSATIASPQLHPTQLGQAGTQSTSAAATSLSYLLSSNAHRAGKSDKDFLVSLPLTLHGQYAQDRHDLSKSRTSPSTKTGSSRALVKATPICNRAGCPVSHTAYNAACLPPLQRRVSEPHSPYASPHATSPHGADLFDRAFNTAASRPRRPSLAPSATAPPVPGTSSARPQDYTGFAGFLANMHIGGRSEAVQDGYDAQDEDYKNASKRSIKKKVNSKDGLYMLGKRTKSPKVQPAQHAATVALRKESDTTTSSSASSSSSSERKPTRFLFGRGSAFKSTSATTAPTSDSLSSEEEESQKARAHDETLSAIKGGRRSKSRPRHNHSTSFGEGCQYVVSVRPQKQTQQQQIGTNSALASSSSSSDEEDHTAALENVNAPTQAIITSATPTVAKPTPAEVRESYLDKLERQSEQEEERGRGRGRRSSSSRVPLISPFTALRDASQATTATATATEGSDSRSTSQSTSAVDGADTGGRGRSRARGTSANMHRSVSPKRSRSRASRSPRRNFTK